MAVRKGGIDDTTQSGCCRPPLGGGPGRSIREDALLSRSTRKVVGQRWKTQFALFGTEGGSSSHIGLSRLPAMT